MDNTKNFIIKKDTTLFNYFLSIAFFLSISITSIASDANQESSPIIGHWDLTVQIDNQDYPSWLEVKLSGFKTLVGRFVGEVGSARPISEIKYENGKFSFSIPPQWDNSDNDMILEGSIVDGQLTGVITSCSGKKYTFTGVKAPLLQRANMNPKWDKPITLFNGKNLDNWHSQKPENQWVVENGILKSPKSGSNLLTDKKFEDFKLHIEFKYPEGGNSGIYLRGRYEVQVEDSKGKEPSSIYLGGVYGFLTPNEIVAKAAGEWQTYDITLIGRRVTIVANGKTVICDQIIPGITGGAIDSNEGEPGPIMLQGDHLPIEYRNIVITPAL